MVNKSIKSIDISKVDISESNSQLILSNGYQFYPIEAPSFHPGFFNFLIIHHNSIFNSIFSTYVRKVYHSKKRKARDLCGGILTLLMVIYFSFSLGNSSQKLLTKRIVYRNNCLFKEAWIMSILTNELYFINVGRIAPEFFSCGIDCFLEIWLRHISKIFTPTGRI